VDTQGAMLDIKLLGAPQCSLDGQPIVGLRRKNRALLFLLAGQGHAISRDNLLSFFWPDYERPRAQKVLRTMLYDLHKALGKAVQVEAEQLPSRRGPRSIYKSFRQF
jgi:DNA-binding SARP family transcriptional activator